MTNNRPFQILIVAATAAAVSLPTMANESRFRSSGQDGARFTDTARVISSTPIYEQVNQPSRECWREQTGYVTQPADRSPAGAVLGAIVGGVVGNQIGKGGGRVASTAAGAAIGAITGDRIDNRDVGTVTRPVDEERCRVIDHWTKRVTGYDVVYRYQGNDYGTFMPYDPGATVRVRVTVAVDDR